MKTRDNAKMTKNDMRLKGWGRSFVLETDLYKAKKQIFLHAQQLAVLKSLFIYRHKSVDLTNPRKTYGEHFRPSLGRPNLVYDSSGSKQMGQSLTVKPRQILRLTVKMLKCYQTIFCVHSSEVLYYPFSLKIISPKLLKIWFLCFTFKIVYNDFLN